MTLVVGVCQWIEAALRSLFLQTPEGRPLVPQITIGQDSATLVSTPATIPNTHYSPWTTSISVPNRNAGNLRSWYVCGQRIHNVRSLYLVEEQQKICTMGLDFVDGIDPEVDLPILFSKEKFDLEEWTSTLGPEMTGFHCVVQGMRLKCVARYDLEVTVTYEYDHYVPRRWIEDVEWWVKNGPVKGSD
jgi:hypothetical protein